MAPKDTNSSSDDTDNEDSDATQSSADDTADQSDDDISTGEDGNSVGEILVDEADWAEGVASVLVETPCAYRVSELI